MQQDTLKNDFKYLSNDRIFEKAFVILPLCVLKKKIIEFSDDMSFIQFYFLPTFCQIEVFKKKKAAKGFESIPTLLNKTLWNQIQPKQTK